MSNEKKTAGWAEGRTPEQRLGAVLICLNAVVEQLVEEGLARQGEYEGLLAYAVLNRLKGNAEAWDVPLAEIGLGRFDPDSLLAKPKAAKAA